jgi:hypothetical protein
MSSQVTVKKTNSPGPDVVAYDLEDGGLRPAQTKRLVKFPSISKAAMVVHICNPSFEEGGLGKWFK